jgi:hypothetical protein
MRFTHQRQHLKLWVLLAFGLAAAARAQDAVPIFDIEAQDAADGLTTFSEQARLQLLFDYDAVTGIRTQAVSGSLRVTDALSRLLNGTGLTFEVINERTISILRDPELIDGAMNGQAPVPKPARRLTWVVNAGDEPQPDPDRAGPLDEIIVTAEKREEPLQRSALAVTALSARIVERQQVTDLKSVTTLIPNLQIGLSSTTPRWPSTSTASIRRARRAPP